MHLLKTLATIGVGLALVGILACGQGEPTATPTPTPTPWPDEALYQFLSSEKDTNATRLEKRVENEERFGFTGQITEIEDAKIQMHVSKQHGEKDEYLECKFDSESKVTNLDKGGTVTVYGNLDKAFPTGKLGDLGFKDNRALKFKNCRVTEIYRP